jgi:hypothetical protein
MRGLVGETWELLVEFQFILPVEVLRSRTLLAAISQLHPKTQDSAADPAVISPAL